MVRSNLEFNLSVISGILEHMHPNDTMYNAIQYIMKHTTCTIGTISNELHLFFLCWTDQYIQRYSRAPIAYSNQKKQTNKNDHNKTHAHTKDNNTM